MSAGAPIDPMRAYLLGVLNDAQADALEDRYFTDRATLEALDARERELLAEYLDRRMPEADRGHFEARYLHVPELRRRLENVRRRRRVARMAALATAAALLLAIVAWFSTRPAARPPQVAGAGAQAALPVVSMELSPGVAMGPSSQMEIAPPPSGARVRLELELPGRSELPDPVAELFRVGADGRRISEWTSSTPLHPERAAGGLSVTVEFDSRKLVRGDYLLTLRSRSGDVLENYVFRLRL